MAGDGVYITSDDGSRQLMVLITTGVLFVSLIAVSIRSYCRAILVRHVGKDDYFMLAALVVSIDLGIMKGFHISYGTGRRSKDLNFDHFLIPTLKHWYVYQLVYPWALFFAKASILALYHRIFTHHNFRHWVYYAGCFIVVKAITLTFINVLPVLCLQAVKMRIWGAGFRMRHETILSMTPKFSRRLQ